MSTDGRRHTPENFATRFWSRVDRRGPDECWPWLGTKNDGTGRGRVHMGYQGDWRERKRIRAYAYVVAWELTNGPVPDGLKVCHHCDNPNCVNTNHLFIGTQADNIRDMHQKCRADSFGLKKHPDRPHGLAAMSPERRREIARLSVAARRMTIAKRRARIAALSA